MNVPQQNEAECKKCYRKSAHNAIKLCDACSQRLQVQLICKAQGSSRCVGLQESMQLVGACTYALFLSCSSTIIAIIM